MTPTQAAEIRTRALRQIVNGRCSVHITARQVEDLACAYLNDEARLAQIADLIPAALLAWACNYRKDTRAAFAEIEQLATTNPQP